MELSVVIAHEFGHVIDFQTKREGHPLFRNIGHLDIEMFAHAIAAFLYTKLVVRVVYNNIGVEFPEMKFVQLDLDKI